MPILTIILVLVIAGVLLWLINAYVPMQPNIKKLLNIAVIIVLVIWLLKVMGIFSSLSGVRV